MKRTYRSLRLASAIKAETMNGNIPKANFIARGQTARQVLACNAIDEYTLQAHASAKQITSLSRWVYILSKVREILAALFLVSTSLFLILSIPRMIVILLMQFLLIGLVTALVEGFRENIESISADYAEHMQNAITFQVWLDEVIRLN